MISGHKGFRKQGVSKSKSKSKTGPLSYISARKRPKKKHLSDAIHGLPVLPAPELDKILHGKNLTTEIDHQREAYLVAKRMQHEADQRAISDAAAAKRVAHEAERQAIRDAAHLEEQRIKYQKEIEMADMQTALSKVIDSWDAEPATDNTIPEVPQVETKSNASVSQTVFDYVRDNPNATRANIAYALTKRGYNSSTVGALVSQFIRQKLFVFGAGKGLIVTRKTYTPMYHRDNKPAKPAVATPQGLAAIVHQPLITQAPEAREQWMPSAPPVAEEWTVESVVDKLNIRQARAVYIELRTLLGVE